MEPVVDRIVAAEVVGTESGKTKLCCMICSISFSAKTNLRKHLIKFHQLSVEAPANENCAVCDQKFRTMPQLLEHLQNIHSITLNFVEKTFYCKKDFLDWKHNMERESLSCYTLLRTSRRSGDICASHYRCHRSGHWKAKQNRIRKLKSTGSVKIGSTCPAFINVSTQIVDGISEIKVHHQSVHIGHDMETRTLRLSREERENLAACLKIGIPMDKVLEHAKQSSSPTSRYSHLTRKSLHNIRKDFKIPMNHEPKRPRQKRVKNKNIAEVSSVKVNDSCLDVNNEKEMSESSIGYEDYYVIEETNRDEIQELETAISSLTQLGNHNSSKKLYTQLENHNFTEEFSTRKMEIVNQLKELQLRIEKWDPAIPLPDVQEHIRALNAVCDFSAFSNGTFNLQGTRPVIIKVPLNTSITK